MTGKPRHRAEQRTSSWRPCIVVCTVAALSILLLPLAVPVPFRSTISASYVAGFNNSAAVVATALISVSVFVFSWITARRSKQHAHASAGSPLGWRFVFGTMAITAFVLGLCGWVVIRSRAPYVADAGYIIEAALAKRETGRALYTQLEFAYGPLLLLPEVWLSKMLHCRMQVSYFIVYVLDQCIGLALLAYTIDALPMLHRMRRVVFALLAFGAISPLLGINYTFLRFATPVAILVCTARQKTYVRATIVLLIGELLALLISPEMGVAMGVGAMALAVARMRTDRRWALAGIAPMVVLVAMFATLGKPYLQMIAQFSRGTLNIPVGPYPHLLVFLFAAVWLVPAGIAPLIRNEGEQGAMLAGVYGFGLATLPPALGRCDPLHVFFNGLALLLLSCVVASRLNRRGRNIWVACLAVLVVWQFYVNEHLLRARSVDVVRLAFSHPDAERFANDTADPPSTTEEALYALDTAALSRIVGRDPVATPLQVAPRVIDALIAGGNFSPGYYSFLVDQMNPQAEERSIREMNAHAWALLPRAFDPPLRETTDDLGGVQGFVLPYPLRHANPTQLGDAFQNNLERNWRPERAFGPYILYRRAESL